MATDSAAGAQPEARPGRLPRRDQPPRFPGPAQRASWRPARLPQDPARPGQPLTERTAGSAPGVPVLLGSIVALGVAIWLIVVAHNSSGGAAGGLTFLIVLLALAGSFGLSGLTPHPGR